MDPVTVELDEADAVENLPPRTYGSLRVSTSDDSPRLA
jgi:hypothetical protein